MPLHSKAGTERKIPIRSGENVRHVVPQHICAESLKDADIRLQMRVKQPMEDPVWVEVRKGENLVARRAEPYARPGEMVTVTLPVKAYDEVQSADELTVAIVKR